MNPKGIKRILVATDFSELATEAVETGMAFARESGATLDLVHVATEVSFAVPPPMDMVRLPLDLPAAVSEASSRLQTEEDRVRASGVTCEGSVLVGRADIEIVDHADKTGSELIIVGTHGRGGLSHVLLGSVAEKVVRHAHCPVLTVRHLSAPRGPSDATSPGR